MRSWVITLDNGMVMRRIGVFDINSKKFKIRCCHGLMGDSVYCFKLYGLNRQHLSPCRFLDSPG